MWRIALELAEVDSPFFVAVTRRKAPAYRTDVEFYAVAGTPGLASARAAELVALLNSVPNWGAGVKETDK